MSLNDRITADLKNAMKEGEKLRLETLRTLRAQMIELQKRGTGTVLTEEEEMGVLLGAIKKRKEAIDLYKQAGRNELVKQEQRELEIIHGYLPPQLTEQEAANVINAIVTETGAQTAKDFGKVMPLAMKQLKGKIDGKIVQQVVRKRLGEGS